MISLRFKTYENPRTELNIYIDAKKVREQTHTRMNQTGIKMNEYRNIKRNVQIAN